VLEDPESGDSHQSSQTAPRLPLLCEVAPGKGDCSTVRNSVHHAKGKKLLEGAPIIYLEFEFLVAKITMLLENEHLEHVQRIDPFAACIALALLRIALFTK
jgi:hypothetical protein